MEPVSNKAADVLARVPTSRRGPRYVTHKQKFTPFPKIAIAAAAIAAVSLSTGVRKKQICTRAREKKSRLSSIELQQKRRPKQNEAAGAVCEEAAKPQCHHQLANLSSSPAYGRSFLISETESSSESETCMNYVKTFKRESQNNNCYGICECAAQNVPREVQHYPNCQPVGYYSQAQLPEQCITFPENHACHALHECCCEHQTPSHSNNESRIPPTNVCCSCLTEYGRIETCCAQRIRHGVGPTVSNGTVNRKKHGHHPGACCDVHPRWPPPETPARTVKAMKTARPKPREHRVQARRIRHPVCDEDSNSESEMNAPVTDVRTLRSAATRSPTSPSPGQVRPFINRPERPLPAVCTSYPPAARTLYPCPGPNVQSNALLTISPGYSNIPPQGNGNESESSSSLSDSSNSSDIPESISSSSTNSDVSTDLSDSSTSSNEESGLTHQPTANPLPQAVRFSPTPSQHNQPNYVQVRNPIHTYYQNPHVGTASTRSTPLPISSGDFWNVRRPWQRTADGRRADVPGYAGTIPREGDNYPAQWIWMGQNPSSNPTLQHPPER